MLIVNALIVNALIKKEGERMCQNSAEKNTNLIRMIIRTNRMHRAAVEAVSEGLGIHRSQHMLLSYLEHNESNGSISQSDIARAFDISPSAVAVTLKKLESSGFVMRGVNDGDNRYNKLTVTEKGKETLLKLQNLFEGVDREMLEGISENEMLVLEKCFEKMQNNLKQHSEK